MKTALFVFGFLAMLMLAQATPRVPEGGIQKRLQTRANCGPGELPNNYDPLFLKYYGGPTLTAPVNIYLIFYGAQFVNLPALQSNLITFINNLAASPWYSYTGQLQGRNGALASSIAYAGSTMDTTLQFGTVMTQPVITNIVLDKIAKGVFPQDANAQYYVLNGDDTRVTANGTTVDYCGYHTWASAPDGTVIKHGFVVVDAHQLSVCGFANGGPYDDVSNSAITTIAHEIIETISDPEPGDDLSSMGFSTSAPGDAKGEYFENGDMCANINFPTQTLPNGRQYTTYIGPNPYYLQANLNIVTNCCGYPTVAATSLTATPAATVIPPSPAASSNIPLSAGVSPSTSQTGAPSQSAPPPPPPSNSPFPTYVLTAAPTSSYQYYGPYCGDGVVDPGEQCDPGYYYFGGSSCCNFLCQYKNVGTICGNSRPGNCYRIPRCARQRGSGTVFCQTNKVRRAGVPCRLAGSYVANGVCNSRGSCVIPRSP